MPRERPLAQDSDGLLRLAIGGGSVGIVRQPVDLVLIGLTLTAMAGIGGLAGFFAAYLVHIRYGAAFDIRPTKDRWNWKSPPGPPSHVSGK